MFPSCPLRRALLLALFLLPLPRLAAAAARAPFVSSDASGNLVLRWTGVSGKHYRLEASTDLVTWTQVPGEYAGAGAMFSPIVRAAGAGPTPKGFWRVASADHSFFAVTYPPVPELVAGIPIAPVAAGVAFPDSRVPITYAITAGALPLGLVLDSVTGAISGMPAFSGEHAFTVTATNGTLTASTALKLLVDVVDDGAAFFWGASPPSTLLPTGATTLAFSVKTTGPASCRYSVGTDLGYAAMKPFATGQGTRAHAVTFTGLNPDTSKVNEVYVRCDAVPAEVLHLRFRALPDPKPSFPRKGNLWGDWSKFKNWDSARLARMDLWVTDLSSAVVAQLRGLNPDVVILDSMNATSPGFDVKVPDSYILKDIHGNRIESWPGAWPLNLTKPEVVAFQVQYAYKRLLGKNLAFDGLFFDNFFTSIAERTTDAWGNDVQIDANEDGQPDDADWLDAAWKAGVYAELEGYRKLMPYAYTMGHLNDSTHPEVQALFDGNSIGFAAPGAKDGYVPQWSLRNLWTHYDTWWSAARATPVLTMIESGPPFEIAYGYGYAPYKVNTMPPATLEFARTFYPYMRWGLGVTLMNDGYFAHELGDSWHGQAWWYDELDFDLGSPLGPSRILDLGTTPTTDLIVNGGFEQGLSTGWSNWVSAAAGASATFTRDASQSASGSASCRVDVAAVGAGKPGNIQLTQKNRSTTQGVAYDVSFKLRSELAQSFDVVLQKGSADWHSYGLASPFASTGPTWQDFTVTFVATETASDGRLTFYLGAKVGAVWVDDVKLVQHPPDVLRRDFEKGTVILNATRSRHTIPVTGAYRRLTGTQAPKFQYVVDDAEAAFTAGSWGAASYDSGQWVALGPWFHDWGAGCHESSITANPASWDLGIRADDTYTLDAWWPAAPAASGWSSAVRYDVVVGGAVVASATLDQTTGGDQWHRITSVALTKAAGAQVRITNLQAKPAIADAILVQSAARYNDGSDAPSVELEPCDAIVLQKK